MFIIHTEDALCSWCKTMAHHWKVNTIMQNQRHTSEQNNDVIQICTDEHTKMIYYAQTKLKSKDVNLQRSLIRSKMLERTS